MPSPEPRNPFVRVQAWMQHMMASWYWTSLEDICGSEGRAMQGGIHAEPGDAPAEVALHVLESKIATKIGAPADDPHQRMRAELRAAKSSQSHAARAHNERRAAKLFRV